MAGTPADLGTFPFWDWSLRVYARPDVAAACLALQDRHGLDVNLLLFGLWLAAEGHALGEDPAAAAAALARIAGPARRWQAEVVQPLRAARRAVRAQVQAMPKRSGEARSDEAGSTLYPRLEACELEAERAEQWLLFCGAAGLIAAPPQPGPAAGRARCHLDAVGLLAGIRWSDEDRPLLATLLTHGGRGG